METFKEDYIRHDRLANEALSEAQQLKALAPAGADGREMREVASWLKRRENAVARMKALCAAFRAFRERND